MTDKPVRRTRHRVLKVGLALLAAVVGVVALLWIEVVVAGNGPMVTEFDPKLADGTFNTVPGSGAKRLKVVWLGDSTAAGVGASAPEHGVARQITERLHRPVDLLVLAVSGNRISDVLAAQVANVPADTDLVVISIGANDVTHLTNSGDFRNDYESVLSRLPKTAAVVIVGLPDLGSPTRVPQPLRAIASSRGDMYDAIARELAQAHGAAYVHLSAQTGPKFRADPDRHLALDHYHPSDAGYTVWADAIMPVIDWKLAVVEHPDQPAPPLPKEST